MVLQHLFFWGGGKGCGVKRCIKVYAKMVSRSFFSNLEMPYVAHTLSACLPMRSSTRDILEFLKKNVFIMYELKTGLYADEQAISEFPRASVSKRG